MLGIHMLNLIEEIHECGYLHRKLMPRKFMIGFREEANKLFLIGWSQAKKFMGKDMKHYLKEEEEDNKSIINEFSSIN